jgi:hypothetical protein
VGYLGLHLIKQAARFAQVLLISDMATVVCHAGYTGGGSFNGRQQAVALGGQFRVGEVAVNVHARNFGG